MNKRIQKIISAITVLTVAVTSLISAPMYVFAADSGSSVAEQNVKTLSFWADPQGRLKSDVQVTTDDGKSTVSALGLVQAHTITSSYSASSTDSNYFLFLPTTADMSSLTLYFDNAESETTSITKPTNTTVSITNGEASDVFAGYGTTYGISDTWKITLKGTQYSFHIVKSAQVGTVFLNTASGSMDYINSAPKDNKTSETGSIQVYDAGGVQDYDGELAKISGHGNGSWDDFKQKLSYNIKLGSSASLCGMAKAKKWILLSGATDGGASSGQSTSSSDNSDTQIKNRLTYDFADYIGIEYQPAVQPVDLYCNGHYMGSYELVEKPEIKSNRVDINDAYENLQIANGTVDPTTGVLTPADFDTTPNLTTYTEAAGVSTTAVASATGYTLGTKRYSAIKNSSLSAPTDLKSPDDVTGGYIFGLEISTRWIEESNGMCAYSRQGWTLRSCDYVNKDMIDYSYDLLYAMGSAVYQSDGNVPSKTTTTGSGLLSSFKTTNPAPATKYQGKHWSDILDAKSAVTYYWTQEFFKNMDASTTSTYFYKDSDSVDSMVYAGPVWDSDNTMTGSGTRFGIDFGSKTGWYVSEQKIYRYLGSANDSSLYNNAPYSFYASLAHQDDFNEMKEDMWYKTVSPAVSVLLGNKEASSRLHSIEWYTNEIKDSATMNNVRFGGTSATYNINEVNSFLTDWVSSRQTWINGEISTNNISTANAAPVEDQIYTGSPITPTINLTYNNSVLGEQALEEGTDYTVSFSNNTNVGTATATITGQGRFIGSTKTVTFKITPNDISTGNLSIYDAAYIGDTIEPTLLDSRGLEVTDSVTYSWTVDGVSAGTGNTYTVKDSDAGKTVVATVTGNGNAVIGTLTSNSCLIANSTRPSGSVKNIATFSWKYGDDGTSLQGGKTKGYSATSGVQKDTATIHASVDGSNYASLDWSGSDTFTRTDGSTGQQPVMAPSSAMLWNEYPYFDVSFSTTDYSDITFSTEIGATKKGAKYYAIMYSIDGGEFQYYYNENPVDEYDYKFFELQAVDNKTMKTAFDLTLPDDCNNKENVTVRIIVDDCYTLEGADTMFTSTNGSGKIAINNVMVNGTKENDVTGLDAPVIETAPGALFEDDNVTITDTNAGVEVYYTLTDGNGNVSPVYTYSTPFAPFGLMDSNSITVSTWSESGIYKSDVVTAEYSFAGDALARFEYKNFSDEVINGALPANGGKYGKSSTLTAVTDGKSQYVPRFDTEKTAYVIAPDDGAKWSSESGFYFTLSTAGYKDVKLSCDALTTAQGPGKVAVQYSTDGATWTSVGEPQTLPANGSIENFLNMFTLPSQCNNLAKVYIRLATTENLTNGSGTLWNNASKGNLYINNIVFSAVSDGSYPMPYTNKSTNYFGQTGTIKYYSPDNIPMQYTVTDADNQVVMSGAYPEGGIQLTQVHDFIPTKSAPYTVSIWAGDDDEQSLVNKRTYYYKGDDITVFDMSTSRFAASVSADSKSVSATTGTGTLSLLPNSTDTTALTYSDSYGVKASWSSANPFKATKSLDNPEGNGYWLINTTTAGYDNVTLSLNQIGSNKAPRDWGIAYSTDGVSYTYVADSNARTISNDAAATPVQTYSNLPLPEECWNQESLYIKVFINGGESVDTTELELVTKGNTGINDIELCGTKLPEEYSATVKATVLESPTDKTGTVPMTGIDVYVDDVLIGATDANGEVTFTAKQGETYSVRYDNGKFSRTVEYIGDKDKNVTAPLVATDLNGDGYTNSRDYMIIYNMSDSEYKTLLEGIYTSFLRANSNTFSYAK